MSVIVAAGGGSFDLARLLADLLIVLIAAKVVGELAERVRIPSVLGEIAAGVIIGPSVLGLVDLTGDRGVSIGVLAEIGVLLLLVAEFVVRAVFARTAGTNGDAAKLRRRERQPPRLLARARGGAGHDPWRWAAAHEA
jgi:hypothetical protein